MAARRHVRVSEPVGEVAAAASTSKSAVSRRFVVQSRTALADLLSRDLSTLDIKALMIDGEHMADRCYVIALAITAVGTEVPVGLWDGATGNKAVVRALRADLVSSGLDATDGLLVVLDGAKALSAVVRQVFGPRPPSSVDAHALAGVSAPSSKQARNLSRRTGAPVMALPDQPRNRQGSLNSAEEPLTPPGCPCTLAD